jgi:hypothetical protein
MRPRREQLRGEPRRPERQHGLLAAALEEEQSPDDAIEALVGAAFQLHSLERRTDQLVVDQIPNQAVVGEVPLRGVAELLDRRARIGEPAVQRPLKVEPLERLDVMGDGLRLGDVAPEVLLDRLA